MVKHKKARSFKISKLKNLLEKLLNLSEATRICGPSKSAAPHRHSFKLHSKLKYLNSDKLPLSKCSKLGYSKSTPTNAE